MASFFIDQFYRFIYRSRLGLYYYTSRNRGDFIKHLIHKLNYENIDIFEAIDLRARIRKDINTEILRKHLQLMSAKRRSNKVTHPLTKFLIDQYISQSNTTLKHYQAIKKWQRSDFMDTPPNVFLHITKPTIIKFIKNILHHKPLRTMLTFSTYLLPCLIMNHHIMRLNFSIIITCLIVVCTYLSVALIYRILKHRLLTSLFIDLHKPLSAIDSTLIHF